MGSFPPAVSQVPPAQGAAPPMGSGAPASGGGSPIIKLTMLSQLIQGLAKDFPGGQQGIKMMLDGLKMIQASAASQSAPPQSAAPPR